MQGMYETKDGKPRRIKVRGVWRTFHRPGTDADLSEQLTKRYGPGTLVDDQWLLAVDQPGGPVTLSTFMPQELTADLEADVDDGA